MKPTPFISSAFAFTSTGQPPARRGRRFALGIALPALVALGALGCSVRVAGDAKNGGDAHASSESRSSSKSDAHASAKAEGSSSARSDADAKGSGGARVSAKAEGSSNIDGSSKASSDADAKGGAHVSASAKLKAPEGKVSASASDSGSVKTSSKVSVDTKSSSKVSVNTKASGKVKVDTKRAVFQTKPRVSALARAKATPVFVGVHGKISGSGSLHAGGSGKVKGSLDGKGQGKDKDVEKDKDVKEKPSKDTKPEVAKNDKPGKDKPAKDPVKKPGKDPVTKGPKDETTKKPVTDKPKKPVEEAPKAPEPQPEPVPTPIEPPAEPPENVFGYEAPVRGCFEGLVYFIPENSQSLPKSYEGLTSSAALYACEWDIPTRAWEQGFPGLEDRFEWFAIRYSGAFQVSQAGSWTFRISSDDGTRLYIDDKLVIDNDGVHAPKEMTGKVDLTAGDHTMVLEYFQGPRYHINLQLFATPPGGSEGIFSVR